MSTGGIAPGLARLTLGHRFGAPLRWLLVFLGLGIGGVVGDREARAQSPGGMRAAGEEGADLPPLPPLPPLPSPMGADLPPLPSPTGAASPMATPRARGRLDTPFGEDGQQAGAGAGAGGGGGTGANQNPNVPGITRFRDLRGLGGTYYEIYGPRILSQALGLTPDSPVQVYGWIQNSFTGNPSQPANGINFGVNPNNLANQWMGNQYYLVLEDKVEESDSINLGWRVDNLFGNDWQFNHMHGLFDTSFQPNHFAGYDPAQLYGEIHLPVLTPGGLDIRGGRWFSIIGFESVPAVTRPLLSTPYMFTYGQPFTHFGMLSTLHVHDRLKVYNGAINGWDRWIDSRYKWGYTGGFIWNSRSGKTSIAASMIWGPNQFPNFLPANTEIVPTGATPPPFLAGRRNLGYGANDRTLFSAVLAHWWTGRLLQVLETDEGLEKNVPGLGPGGTARDASWYGLGNWFLWSIIQDEDFHVLTGVWRAEAFRDNNGARTGYADTFYETTLGLIYRPEPWLWVRPEARFDWAAGAHPYNDGQSGSQFTIAFDVIFLF